MEPARRADRRTLIRRATYDLIGLPPTPEEVAAFVADESPGRVCDSRRSFASPRRITANAGAVIGWTSLDTRRVDGPFAFTYRDYVIRAFNDDLPYDEFLIQQTCRGSARPWRGQAGRWPLLGS